MDRRHELKERRKRGKCVKRREMVEEGGNGDKEGNRGQNTDIKE